MKFHLQSATGKNLFTAHGAGYIAVNGVRYTGSLVVTPDRVIEDWPATDFGNLNAQHFEFLLALKPDILLLGTGATLRFPPPRLVSCLYAARIGLEVMDNPAVCRTYNILTAEGRNVVAAMLPG